METRKKDKRVKPNAHEIIAIQPGSPASGTALSPGDFLLTIDGKKILDVFDYRFLIQDSSLNVRVQRLLRDPGSFMEFTVTLRKEPYEDLGLEFETGLMAPVRPCANRCRFCFIDQLPPGMRETLYFKDDDPRLSFLQGSYVTLTNLPPGELARLLSYHLSPINISVHAMDLPVRRKLLGRPYAQSLRRPLAALAAAGVSMNFQIVLLKGVNDGPVLTDTLRALGEYLPKAQSVSVVPVGLTKYREGLPAITPFTGEDCARVVRQVEGLQAEFLSRHGLRFVFAADEFYIRGGLPLPPCDAYEDFPQLENGVGMAALTQADFARALGELPGGDAPQPAGPPREISLVTGICAQGLIRQAAQGIQEKLGVRLRVYPIVNEFFGPDITVSGLLTGRDMLAQLRGQPLGAKVIVPGNVLRAGDDVLLDDMSLPQLSQSLGTPVEAAKDPWDLLERVRA